MIQTGTVDAAAQREALLGEKKEAPKQANPEAASGSGPAQQEEEEVEARAESDKGAEEETGAGAATKRKDL